MARCGPSSGLKPPEPSALFTSSVVVGVSNAVERLTYGTTRSPKDQLAPTLPLADDIVREPLSSKPSPR